MFFEKEPAKERVFDLRSATTGDPIQL